MKQRTYALAVNESTGTVHLVHPDHLTISACQKIDFTAGGNKQFQGGLKDLTCDDCKAFARNLVMFEDTTNLVTRSQIAARLGITRQNLNWRIKHNKAVLPEPAAFVGGRPVYYAGEIVRRLEDRTLIDENDYRTKEGALKKKPGPAKGPLNIYHLTEPQKDALLLLHESDGPKRVADFNERTLSSLERKGVVSIIDGVVSLTDMGRDLAEKAIEELGE